MPYRTEVRMTYWCITCDNEEIYGRPEFIEHLRRDHSIEPARSKPEGKYVLFMDMRGGYMQVIEYALEGVVFRKSIHSERVKIKEN